MTNFFVLEGMVIPLNKSQRMFWSKKEIETLKKVYLKYETIEELLSYFPNRTRNGISIFAQTNLGLKRTFRAKPNFSEETIQLHRERFIKINNERKKTGIFKGKGNPFYGKTHDAETIKKRVATFKANKNKKTRKGYKQPSCAGELNPAKRPEVRAKISRNGSIAQKKFLREHPEKNINYRLRRNRMTKIERKMKKILIDLGLKEEIDFKHNQYVKTVSGFKFPDFLIKNKIVVECDGEYWHKNRQKDAQRDQELLRTGLTVVHFKGKEIKKHNNEVKEKLGEILNCCV